MFAQLCKPAVRLSVVIADLQRWSPRVLAALAFVLYALAAPPGFYWLDSAELSAAAIGLGVAHPTGFPLYCVLGKVASLVPVGELAFRVNLLSALSAALAVLWTARLVSFVCAPSKTGEQRAEEWGALAGGLAAGATLAVSLTFFRQATVAEVYAPNAALLAGTLLLFARVALGGGARDGLLLALVAGLGLGVHTTYMLAGVPISALLLIRLFRGARWPLLSPVIAVTAAGALYLYLPARAASGIPPPIEWEDASTANGFVRHVSGERIRHAFRDEMRSTVSERVTHNANVLARDVADQLMLAILAALAGFAWLASRRPHRWVALALGVVVLGDFVYSFWLNPMGQGDLQNGVPLALGVCAAAGVGVALFARMLGRASIYAGLFAGVVLVVPAASVSWSPVWAASSGDLPRRWSEGALAETPPRGLIVVTNDSSAAGLIFLTAIEEARPDVAVLVRQQMRGEPARTRRILARSAPGMPAASVFGSGRPITWETGGRPPPPEFAVVAGAPMSRLAPAGVVRTEGSGDVRRAALRLLDLFDHPSAKDRSANLLLAHTLNSLGRIAQERGDLAAAVRAYDAAIAVRPRFARALVNRGVAAAASGDFEAAIRYTERALGSSPNHEIALVNLARYSMKLGHDDVARSSIDRALDLDPNRADAWAIRGVLDARAGDYAHAREALGRALELDPQNADARRATELLDSRQGAQ